MRRKCMRMRCPYSSRRRDVTRNNQRHFLALRSSIDTNFVMSYFGMSFFLFFFYFSVVVVSIPRLLACPRFPPNTPPDISFPSSPHSPLLQTAMIMINYDGRATPIKNRQWSVFYLLFLCHCLCVGWFYFFALESNRESPPFFSV